MDLPENYKPEHRYRVYYPNRCNLCFLKEKLMKCGACLAVTYCCKEHQIEDWPFHKPTCNALRRIKKKVQYPANCSPISFYQYRTSLAAELTKLRNVPNPNFLTIYEYQICMVPMVCPVCFITPTKKFECSSCQSVVYCSMEHLKDDVKNHTDYCLGWTISRIYNSFFYENGDKLKIHPLTYRKIDQNIKSWPETKYQLFDLIQINTKFHAQMPIGQYGRIEIFLDPYIPASIIINVLEMTDSLKNRMLVRRSDKKSSKMRRTMTIHFAIADDYELSFQWNEIAQLLIDWITNIHKIEIVLTGPMLKHCAIPVFNTRTRVAIKVHQKAYHECTDLPEPDVIILLECHRALIIKENSDGLDQEQMNALLQFDKTLLIFSDGRSEVMSELFKRLYNNPNMGYILSSIQNNGFTEMRMVRIWKEKMDTLTRNKKLLYLMKD